MPPRSHKANLIERSINSVTFGMELDIAPKLGIPLYIQLGQRGIAAIVLCPATAIDGKRCQDDTRHLGTNRTIKPVFAIDHMHLAAIRHHEAAPVRQADKVPESPLIFRYQLSSQCVHLQLGQHEIIAEQIRQERKTVGSLQRSGYTDGLHIEPPRVSWRVFYL